MDHTLARIEPMPDFRSTRPSDRPTGFHRTLILAAPPTPVRVRRGKIGRWMQRFEQTRRRAADRLDALVLARVRGRFNRRSLLPFA